MSAISDIKYNQHHHKMIITSHALGEGLAIYSPRLWNSNDQYPHPQWKVGGSMCISFFSFSSFPLSLPSGVSVCVLRVVQKTG